MPVFMLEILAPDMTVFSGRVVSVTARAIDGEVQILAGHAPYVNVLAPGDIKVRTEENGNVDLHGDGGIIEVARDKTSLLVFTS